MKILFKGLISGRKSARLALVAGLAFISNMITSLWALPYPMPAGWWSYILTYQPLTTVLRIAINSGGAEAFIGICVILTLYVASVWAVISQSRLLFRVSATKTKIAFALAGLAVVTAYLCAAFGGWQSPLEAIGFLLLVYSLPSLLTFWVLMTLASLSFRRFGNKSE
jgi:hypothetical protein